MPYYYSSTNTPVQNSGRQISLSLKDLDASVGSIGNENYPENKSTKQQDKECSDNTLRSSYHDVDQHEQHYQQNVHTLLNKSNGSKYEEMIKKFLSSTNHSETGTALVLVLDTGRRIALLTRTLLLLAHQVMRLRPETRSVSWPVAPNWQKEQWHVKVVLLSYDDLKKTLPQ